MQRISIRVWAVVIAFIALGTTAAHSSDEDVRTAYNNAARCFVVNWYVSDTFKKAGDAANTNLFSVKAKRAFDAAHGYSVILHLSLSDVKKDFARTTEAELRKLVPDKNYLTVAAKFCKSHGLM